MGKYPIQDAYINMLADHQRLLIEGLEAPDALHKSSYGFWNNKIPVSIINVYGTYLVDTGLDARNIAIGRRVSGELYRLGEIGLMMQRDKQYINQMLGEEAAHHLEISEGYLLVKRNRNWIKRLLPALKKQSNLIVVGAFHLPGETGLVELLRREGLLVDRIVLPGEASTQ